MTAFLVIGACGLAVLLVSLLVGELLEMLRTSTGLDLEELIGRSVKGATDRLAGDETVVGTTGVDVPRSDACPDPLRPVPPHRPTRPEPEAPEERATSG